jgi:hypothetical protein
MNYRWLGALAIAFTACNNVETAIVPLYPVAPTVDMMSGGCLFEEGSASLLEAPMDLSFMGGLFLGFLVQNNLSDTIIPLETNPREETVNTNAWRPIRFDYTWECDNHSFLVGLPPLVVPAFSVQQPFCYDQTEDTEDFVGTDVVPISGQAILPQDDGVVLIQAVSGPTAQALAGSFDIAKLAESCCAPRADGTGGCYDNEGNFDVSLSANAVACTNLDNVLRGQSGDTLSTANGTGVELFRPFSRFTDGSGETYSMRLRGAMEGVTMDGATMFSSDLHQDVLFCLGSGSAANPCTPIVPCSY